MLTEALDRGTAVGGFVDDGKNVLVTVTDDRTVYLAKVPVTEALFSASSAGHAVGQPSHAKGRIVKDVEHIHRAGRVVCRRRERAAEVIVTQRCCGVRAGSVPAEDIAFKSKDGSEIHALLTKPLGYVSGRRYPTLVRIHGGPTAQDAHNFAFERQIFAANGYVVVNINYRGSSGRGAKFSEAIFADWGNLEVADVLAGVDHLVAAGIADPETGDWRLELRRPSDRLRDRQRHARFKAAISGAGSANHISLYGHDQYTFLYDNEFGPPWKNLDLWVKFSHPFFKADRIMTPTLFMGGQDDFNVPILGSEQMYQALKTMNVPTSWLSTLDRITADEMPFLRDRMERTRPSTGSI